MADHLNFGDICQEVERLIKQFKGAKETIVKEVVNMAYLELLNCDVRYALHWLLKTVDNAGAKAPVAITGITSANPPVVSSVHSFVDGDIVGIHGVGGMTEVNNRVFLVDDVTAGVSLELQNLDTATDINGAAYTAYTSGGYLVHRGITVGESIRRVLSAGFQDYDPMTPLSEPDSEKKSDLHSLDNYSRPYYYTHLRRMISTGEVDRILWYPACDQAYTSRYVIEAKPSRMENLTDIPQLLPQFHQGIIAGALSRLVEYDVRIENALIWPKIYEWHLLNLRAYNRRWWQKHQEGGQEAPFMI